MPRSIHLAAAASTQCPGLRILDNFGPGLYTLSERVTGRKEKTTLTEMVVTDDVATFREPERHSRWAFVVGHKEQMAESTTDELPKVPLRLQCCSHGWRLL